jgi:lipopolysaccharide/colanic/teichoic acid biosynthesis glycosyltransferase
MLLILMPVIFVLFLILVINNHGQVFFFQKRTGIHLKTFSVIKFRTLMVNNNSLFRTFLRNTHLDELPQLINIIKGEMSFIGPRPLLPEYEDYYDKKTLQRFDVKPGLLGLTQVSRGDATDWNRKFLLDIFYVQHNSFRLDLYIICLTIKKILQLNLRQTLVKKPEVLSYIDYRAKKRSTDK